MAENRIKTILTLAVVAMVIALTAGSADAATMSASPAAPPIDGADIANYGAITGTDKWWADQKTSGYPKGQTRNLHSTLLRIRSLRPRKLSLRNSTSFASARLMSRQRHSPRFTPRRPRKTFFGPEVST